MLLLVIRCAVHAAICCALLLVWAERESGHAAMGIVAGGILTSWAAAVAWIAAIVAVHSVDVPSVGKTDMDRNGPRFIDTKNEGAHSLPKA